MLVDPSTGMPIGYSTGGTIGSQVSAAVGDAAGVEDSVFYNTIENMPAAFATMGWNANRGARTIMKGPKGRRYNAWGSGRRVADALFDLNSDRTLFSSNPRGLRTTFNPKYFGRFGSAHALGGWGDNKQYSPMQFLYRPANAVGNWAARLAKSSFDQLGDGPSAKGKDTHIWSKLKSAGILPDNADDLAKVNGNRFELFNSGFFARATAQSRYMRYGGLSLSARKMRNLRGFLNTTDSTLGAAVNGMGRVTGRQASALVGMSQGGRVSQYAAGLLHGAKAGPLDDVMLRAAKGAGRQAFIAGTEGAGKLIAKKAAGSLTAKAALWGLRGAGMFIPGLNGVMTAWMIYDLVKMGASALGKLPDLTRDAVTSFKGQINKPVFGMGYKDNTVAATSRQRGVMAIQNSRLNARSVLGNEAAPLAAHFG